MNRTEERKNLYDVEVADKKVDKSLLAKTTWLKSFFHSLNWQQRFQWQKVM